MRTPEIIENFFAETTKDQELHSTLMQCTETEEFCKVAAEQGRKRGYDFSEEEMQKHVGEKMDKELKGEELNVAGGNIVSDTIFSVTSPGLCTLWPSGDGPLDVGNG